MIIQYLKLNNFGRFNKKELGLSDGINIIYGENEAGKTTIHSFIRAMFFGVARARGRAAANDVYSQYEPWENPAFYEGSMEFVSMGKRYRIDRVFQKNVKNAVLTDLMNGEVIPTGERGIEKLVDGLSEESFYNTISVSQTETGIDGIIANLNMSRSSQINVKEALESLSEKRKSLEKKKQALGIEEIESRLREYEDIDQKKEAIYERLSSEKRKIEQIRQKQSENVQNDKNTQNTQNSQNSKSSQIYTTHSKNVFVQRMAVILPVLALICGYAFVQMHLWYFLIAAILCVVADVWIIYRALKNAAIPRDTDIKTNTEIKTNTDIRINTDVKIIEPEVETLRNIERLGWEIDSITALANRRDDLFEELEECRKQKQELDKKSSSVALAISTIQSFSKDIESDFGEVLNELASEYISRFTRGKYDNLRVIGNNNVTICEDGKVVSMGNVSYATREQIYLSVRLAASKLLFPMEEMPIILDEAFAHYDDFRLEDTLLSLASMGTQIIIFTCTGREKEMLEKSGAKYNYIEL